jgi:hypothetical protein
MWFLILTMEVLIDYYDAIVSPYWLVNVINFPGDINAGSGHNLDLSLGISQPSNDPKGNDSVGDSHCRYGGCEIPRKERQVVWFYIRCLQLIAFFHC